jgi:voltage-gated potassium channel
MADTAAIPESGWYDKIQGDVYTLLESTADTNKVRKVINQLYFQYTSFFYYFDLFTVIVFTTEYVLRIWCCVKNPLYSSPVKGRIRYALSPYALVDLIALTPFYLPLFIPIEFRLLRLLRLLRLFRVLRLGKYSNAFETFVDVLKSRKEEFVITIVMAIIILILASSALYSVERDAQPEKFGNIPDAMWWAVVTLATVGYGDVYPITPSGKFIAAIVALSAIGLFALPAGILASGFAESLRKKREDDNSDTIPCPMCGAVIDLDTGYVRDVGNKGKNDTPPEEVSEILKN